MGLLHIPHHACEGLAILHNVRRDRAGLKAKLYDFGPPGASHRDYPGHLVQCDFAEGASAWLLILECCPEALLMQLFEHLRLMRQHLYNHNGSISPLPAAPNPPFERVIVRESSGLIHGGNVLLTLSAQQKYCCYFLRRGL